MGKVYSAVKAVIVKDGKILFIKQFVKGKEVWDLPGGRIEYGESPQEALAREIKEELGMDITVLKQAGVYWFFRIVDKDQVICNAFLCKASNNEISLAKNPSLAEDIREFQWLDKHEALDKDVSDESLKELIKNLNLI